MSARKLWIGFAVAANGRITVDDGAAKALRQSGGSLLTAGIVNVENTFGVGEAVEIVNLSGEVFAKGLSAFDSATANRWKGSRTEELPVGTSPVAIHRDDLVVLDDPE